MNRTEPDILTLLSSSLNGRRATQITGFLSEMISTGQVAAGTRLPTVRAVADALGISPGSVAAVWVDLRDQGLIQTHRRGGTVVAGNQAAAFPVLAASDVWTTMDLAYGVPDPTLQPDLAPAFAAILATARRDRTRREGLSAALHEAVEADWPFLAEAFLPVGGHNEGTVLAIEAAAPRDSLVAIENPTSPRILSILGLLGLKPLPVECDASGPLPDALEMALGQRPTAFIFQPRAQIPLGHSVSDERLAALADVLGRSEHPVNVVEDDHMGPIAMSTDLSLGSHYSGPILHVRGYCKAYGVELRTCVIGGSGELIDKVQQLRAHGVSATSQLLQDALAWLIRDPRTQTIIDRARRHYAERRLSLAKALMRRGIKVRGDDGMLLCLPVPDETAAIVNLAKSGIAVGPGSKCFIAPVDVTAPDFVRIATSLLPDNPGQMEYLASAIANAVENTQEYELD